MFTLTVSVLALESVLILLSNLPHQAASLRDEHPQKPIAFSLAEAEAYIGGQLHEAMAQAQLGNMAQRNTSSELDAKYKPIMEVNLCIQVDIDMSTQVPGMMLHLGLLGAIEYNFKNDCWGTKLEASIGVSFGFKVWGCGFRFSLSATGFLHTHELPLDDVVSMESTHPLIKKFAEKLDASVDKTKCSTSNPISVALTAVRHYIHRKVGEPDFESEMQKAASNMLMKEELFLTQKDAYQQLQKSPPNPEPTTFYWAHADAMPLYQYISKAMKQGTNVWKLLALAPYLEEPQKKTVGLEFTKPMRRQNSLYDVPRNLPDEIPSTTAFQKVKITAQHKVLDAGNFTGPAVGMHKTMRAFVEKLPSYSSQVLTSLVEKDAEIVKKGFDWREIPHVRLIASIWKLVVEKPFFANEPEPEDNTGRFLARYPHNIAEAHEGKYYKNKNSDQRVMNFPKVMKNPPGPPDGDQTTFWKEIAISASNLLVRSVGDIRALFASHFAGDAYWDGNCESLNLTLNIRAFSFVETDPDISKYNRKAADMLEDYPWASSEISNRHSFAIIERLEEDDSKPKRTIGRVLADLDRSLSLQMTPRITLQKTVLSRMERHPLKEGESGEHILPLLWCRLAENAAEVSESEIPVLHDHDYMALANAKEGIVVRLRQACHTVTVREDEGRYVIRRPECEEATLPRSFVRIFPRFVDIILKTIWRVEVLLLEINFCMDQIVRSLLGKLEEHMKYVLHSGEERRQRCDSGNSNRTQYVKEKAHEVVDLVKQFLLQMGGHIDLQPVQTGNNQPSDAPTQNLKQQSHGIDTLGGALAAILADDFMRAFGIGIIPDTLGELEDNEDTRTQMTGHLKNQFKNHLNELTREDLHGSNVAPAVLQADPNDVKLLGYVWQLTDWSDASNFDINVSGAQALKGTAYRWEEEMLLRPWVEYEYGFKVSLTLSKADFCRPPSAAGNAEIIDKYRAVTWTNEVEHSECTWFLWHPGTTSIEYLQCKTSTNQLITSFQLKFNIVTLAWSHGSNGNEIAIIDALLGTVGKGFHGFLVAGANMASMASVYNMLNTEEAGATTTQWIERIGAMSLPLVTHMAVAGGENTLLAHMKNAFTDMGVLTDLPKDGLASTGFAGINAAHVLIGSYTSIVKCKLPCNNTDDQDVHSTLAWIFVNEVSGKFVVPGAFDVEIVGSVVLIWPKRGTRLPRLRFGDVDQA